MLYHVSQTAGLTVLTPHASTHKTPYVYAIDNLVTGLLFGVKQDDFDFIISTDEHGVPTMEECYPNAFALKYYGKSCSVYLVEETGFLRGMTSWSPELVCPAAVPVIEEQPIEDLYDRLCAETENGALHLVRYTASQTYRAKIAKHIVDRLIRFNIDLAHCMEHDIRFSTHYRTLIEALQQVQDGHLLA